MLETSCQPPCFRPPLFLTPSEFELFPSDFFSALFWPSTSIASAFSSFFSTSFVCFLLLSFFSFFSNGFFVGFLISSFAGFSDFWLTTGLSTTFFCSFGFVTGALVPALTKSCPFFVFRPFFFREEVCGSPHGFVDHL